MAKKGKSFANKAQQLVSNEPAPEEPTSVATVVPEPEAEAGEPKRFRTTIMMSEEAIELVDAIQRKYRRQHKKRITKGDVYELGIKELAERMGIEA